MNRFIICKIEAQQTGKKNHRVMVVSPMGNLRNSHYVETNSGYHQYDIRGIFREDTYAEEVVEDEDSTGAFISAEVTVFRREGIIFDIAGKFCVECPTLEDASAEVHRLQQIHSIMES
jgi:hypothetical protein